MPTVISIKISSPYNFSWGIATHQLFFNAINNFSSVSTQCTSCLHALQNRLFLAASTSNSSHCFAHLNLNAQFLIEAETPIGDFFIPPPWELEFRFCKQGHIYHFFSHFARQNFGHWPAALNRELAFLDTTPWLLRFAHENPQRLLSTTRCPCFRCRFLTTLAHTTRGH